MRSFLRRHAVLVAALSIFLIAFMTRTGALKQYVAPDESSWVWRSLNFSRALATGDWAGTAQMGHPGVTTMWLGSFGILVKRAADPVATNGALEWLNQISTLAPENAEALKRLGIFLTYARLPVILVNALGVVVIYLLTRRLWGQRVSVMAGLLFALDPFAAGLSGLLHVDGLLTTFSVLSILAMLNGASSPRPPSPDLEKHKSGEGGDATPPLPKSNSGFRERGLGGEAWFALAGAFAGLALLSKSPGLFLTGFAVVVLLLAIVTRRLSFKHALFSFLSFFVVLCSLFIALYPAMWVQPIETLGGIFGLAKTLGENAIRPTFFDGQFALNHGPNFYPLALAFRLTPVLVFGLIAALIGIVIAAWQRSDRQTFAVIVLLIGAALFIALITPAAKKYDRYLLPAEALLILVAAWGIGQIRSGAVRSLALIGAAALVLLNWPYLLMHYNALLGGVPEAQKRFAVGWGEGLGAAANWINQQPDGVQAVAATSAIPSFAPLFSGQARNTYDRDLELSDYYVITLSERQLSPQFYADLLARGEVVQTLRTGTVDGAWVLRNKQARWQAEALHAANPQTDAIVTLIDQPVSHLYAGDAQLVTLPRDVTSNELEQILNDLSTRYRRLWFAWSEAVSSVVQQQMQHWLDQTATLAQQQSFGDTQIAVYDLQPGQIGRIDPFRVQFGGNLALVDVVPVAHGRSGSIEMRWQPLAPVTAPYTATLQVVDSSGAAWSVTGRQIQNTDQVAAVQWPIGRAVDQTFGFKLPDEAPPGQYDVRVSIDQADGTRAGLVSAAGNFSGTAPILASFEVPPLPEALDRLERATEHPYAYRWDDAVELVGFDSGPGWTTHGNLWAVDVVWRSMSDHLRDLQVVWEVRDQNDHKMFRTRLPLSIYPTSSWREGEIIGARYLLRFPADLRPADYHISIGVADADGELLEGGLFTPFDVRVLSLPRSFDRPAPQHPLAVVFDDPAIKLIGADFSTQTLRAGDTLPLTLYWQAGTTTENLYTAFVHLETLAGEVVAQIDSTPQRGGMPTAWWATGQVIDDPYTLRLPLDLPPGAYRILVGMYNPLDGTHLIDTRTGEGEIVLEPAVIVK